MPKFYIMLKQSIMQKHLTSLIAIVLAFFALPANGQKAVIVQIRPMTVQIRGIGTTEYIFAESSYEGRIKLLLLPAESNAKPGENITIYEEPDKPRRVEVCGKKWYCYLRDYLNQIKSN